MLNCAHCNAPLQIEDENCAYCGAPNPHFTAHRAQMKDMTEEFEETQQEVVETAKRTTRATAQIAIVCALVALNLLMMVLMSCRWDIQRAYQTWRTNQNLDTLRTKLEEYSDAQDPLGMCFYYDYNVFGYNNALTDYTAVRSAIQTYQNLQDDIFTLVLYQEDDYTSPADLASYISSDLTRYYRDITPTDWDYPETFNATHQATIDMTTARLEALLTTYLGIPAEEIPAFLELSEARRAVMIEEGVIANAE